MDRNVKNREIEEKQSFKSMIAELGISPFRLIRSAFALMGVIPLLMFSYIIVKGNFVNNLFIGSNAVIACLAIGVSLFGFIYAYNIVVSITKKLISYSLERQYSEQEKMELVIAASHDIKTPLTVIKTSLHNILNNPDGFLSEEQTKTAEVCLKSTDKLVSYTNEILDISRVNITRTNLSRRPVDFGRLVEKKFREASDKVQGNGRRFTYKILSTDSNVWADKEKMSAAVSNLFLSVFEGAPKEAKVEVALYSDRDSVKLAVTNRGPQATPNQLVEMFTKYQRPKPYAGLSGTSKNKKFGIDFSIIKDIVDLHRGHFSLRNVSDKCNEFSLVLPKDLRGKQRIPLGVAS